MDPILYNAAVAGDICVLRQNKERLKNEKTKSNTTVLHLASQSGHTQCVQEILTLHPSLLKRENSRGQTALHLAAMNGHATICAALIDCAKKEAGVDEESGVLAGAAPSRYSIYKILDLRLYQLGEVRMAKKLLRHRNMEGNTALHEASQYNHPEVVRVLTIQDSTHWHEVNNVGETPLYLAAVGGHSLVVGEILANCSSPSYHGPHGTTALHAAVMSNSVECVRKLLRVEWKRTRTLVRHKDMNGRVPVHYGAFMGHKDVVRELLLVDASTAYIRDGNKGDGDTAVDIATNLGHVAVLEEIILQCPDSWDNLNAKQQNILHIAVKNGQEAAIEFILKSCPVISSLINQKDVDGNTPLHLIATSCCLVKEFINHTMVNVWALNKKLLTSLDLIIASSSHPPEARVQVIGELTRAGATSSFKRLISKDDDDAENRTGTPMDLKNRMSDDKNNNDKEIENLKKMADTHMIVAALVATVAFAAGFTVPGGYIGDGKPDQGLAVLRKSKVFQTFIVANTLALALSIWAISFYFRAAGEKRLSILKRVYKTAKGVAQISILAMLIAFLTGTYVTLAPSGVAIATCIVGSIMAYTAASALMAFEIKRRSIDRIERLMRRMDICRRWLGIPQHHRTGLRRFSRYVTE